MVKVSVVIPMLNEAACLPALLAILQRETVPHEMIVVDGGSRDKSIEIAHAYQCRVSTCEPGRGQQLHSGARVATGDILLFLHADSQFSVGGLACICQQLIWGWIWVHIMYYLRINPEIIANFYRSNEHGRV